MEEVAFLPLIPALVTPDLLNEEHSQRSESLTHTHTHTHTHITDSIISNQPISARVSDSHRLVRPVETRRV